MNTERWHGTAGGYTNHACRCPDCREAWRIYDAARRKRVREGQPSTRPVHDPICAVEACGRPYYAKGLCRAHRQRVLAAERAGRAPNLATAVGEAPLLPLLSQADVDALAARVDAIADPLALYALMWLLTNPEESEEVAA